MSNLHQILVIYKSTEKGRHVLVLFLLSPQDFWYVKHSRFLQKILESTLQSDQVEKEM